MSNVFDAIAWAIKVSKGEPMPARMLLIVGLAQRVNDKSEGFMVWPSNAQLCADTDMSRTSVKKWMRHLEDKGFVQRFASTRENGTSSSNQYRLPVRAVFFHPTKGAMPEDDCEGSYSDPQAQKTGRHPTGGGSDLRTPTGRPARPPIEPPYEPPLEHYTVQPEEELDLGLPALPPKDPTPSDVAEYVEEEWRARGFLTPLRGSKLSEANAEKARDLGKAFAIEGQTALDTWREIFARIDVSDWLQGKVPSRDDRPAFKCSISFMLEKRNFDKVLQGRYNGKSDGELRRGTTSEATGRVLQRLRTGRERRAGRGGPALPHPAG